jgi:hypothetical protein
VEGGPFWAQSSSGLVSQPAASNQKKMTPATASATRPLGHSRIAAKKSANKVNRINLNGVTYGFQGIHAAAIAPLRLHRKHVERTLTRVRYGGSESWNDRQRLAEIGDIADCDRFFVKSGCYARHWRRGDVLHVDVSWPHFKKEVR